MDHLPDKLLDLLLELRDLPREQQEQRLSELEDATEREAIRERLEFDRKYEGVLKFPPPFRDGSHPVRPGSPPFPVPGRIGRYELLELLGQGGMGAVYRARTQELRQLERAIKVLCPPSGVAPDATRWVASARANLSEEAEALAQVTSPNVAAIIDFDYHEGIPFLVMELVEGRTLTEHVNKNGLGGRARLLLARGIAKGLVDVHAKSIVHRDLKPSNVMVGSDGVPRLLDFGIASLVEASSEAQVDGARPVAAVAPTGDGGSGREFPEGRARADQIQGSARSLGLFQVVGTPGYIPPELERAGARATPRSDIWTFGRILEDLFPPATRSDARSPRPEAWPNSPIAPIPAGSELPAWCRHRLEGLTRQCLERNPGKRPATMDVVLRELDRVLGLSSIGDVVPRLLWVAAAIVAVIVIWFGLHVWWKALQVPTNVYTQDKSVILEFAKFTRTFSIPDSIDARLGKEAWILHPTPDRQNWLIGSWSGADKRAESHVFVWNKKGRVLAVIDPVGDSPYQIDEGNPRAWVTDTWIGTFLPPDQNHPELILLDYANWVTGIFRAYELTQDSVTEICRLYHAGHINDRLRFARSWNGEKRQIWLMGAEASGSLKEAARVRGESSSFLACFDFPFRGTSVFPPWTEFDPSFHLGGPEPYTPAAPELYFVARCVTLLNGKLEWKTSRAFEVDQFFHAEPGNMDILLSNTLRIELRQPDPDGPLRMDSNSGDAELLTILHRQALDAGLDADSLVHEFVVDSMLTLGAARPGLEITGPIRDLRSQLPAAVDSYSPASR
ncbi:MAG: serine/threonine protein kinase [Candidatus Eisenbacteria bacterium]|uniref:Serine/threonine protein kinase n=1 Tax=Eiseniibacteriota bacterium TaxID=2212470 RepID=A0A956M2Q7_UNCEI|nr:serine/threonine protein kinase [Candidatus Eisenbacteria bacterium]